MKGYEMHQPGVNDVEFKIEALLTRGGGTEPQDVREITLVGDTDVLRSTISFDYMRQYHNGEPTEMHDVVIRMTNVKVFD